MKQPAVYIMASSKYGTLYTGVTSNLMQRVYEHKNKIKSGFTSRYSCASLVYYVIFKNMEAAITEEKRIKGGSRRKKLSLIQSVNPEWKDLYESF